MFWVYILSCCDKSYYTGHTDNLEQRLVQHHNRMIPGCYTYSKLPVELVYAQDFSSREEALAAEQQIKGWSRRKKEALIQSDWQALSDYAKRKNGAKASRRRCSGSSARTVPWSHEI